MEIVSYIVAAVLGFNWILLAVVAGTALPVIYLTKVSNDPGKAWRWEQSISDDNGRAYSPSLTYMGTFMLGYLVSLTLIAAKEWGYLIGLFATMSTTFAVVSTLSRNTKSKETIATINKFKPDVELSPGTIINTREVKP